MSRAALLPLVLLCDAACAPAPTPGVVGAGAVPLAYDLAEPRVARYGFADTTEFSIQAGPMGVMRVLSAESGLAEVAFRGAGEELEAVVRLVRYSGRFENPSHGAIETDEGGITGAWTVRLDRRGRLEVLDTPSLSDAARQIAGPESLVRPLFAHLPGSRAEAGAVWVDTVSLTEEGPESVTRARSIITSTLVGDTVVAGQPMALIGTESAMQVEVEGTSGGVRILQRMSGTIQGVVLWNPAASTLVERTESGALTGTLELPDMGFQGLPVEAVVRRWVGLRP